MTLWKLREITDDISSGNIANSKGSIAMGPIASCWSKEKFSQMITLKNRLKKPNNWLQKRKNKIGNLKIVGLIKEEALV